MSDSSSDLHPVEALAEDFLARQRRGERPAMAEYLARHPELADEIRAVFPALLAVEQLKPAPEGQTGPYLIAGTDGRSLERIGDYRLLRDVGRGGMGIVYEAEQVSLGRHVALKVLPGHSLLDPRRLERFRREARAAAKLHHTNIVPVFGVGEENGLHYYVMQFIQGQALSDVLTELRRLRRQPGDPELPASADASAGSIARSLVSGQFPPAPDSAAPTPPAPSSVAVPPLSDSLSGSGRSYWQNVARVGVQVAEALEYAHRQGILHRDVKPSNLLLDARGNVWVTDFGLAKGSDSEDLTSTGDIVGTLRYMAPEHFQGQADIRSDLYSLGLTLYELATLNPAYSERDNRQLMHRVLEASAPPPRKVNAEVPRDLETIILKATAREPAHRYQTPGEMIADLRRFLEDRPIRARRASKLEQTWRWCRRNPLVASLLAALFCSLVGGVAFTTVSALKAHRAAENEVEAREEAEQGKRQTEALLGAQFVTSGMQLLEKGDISGALVWFARAAEVDQSDADRTAMHRLRLATFLPHCPRPAHVWFHDERIRSAAFSADGKRLLVVTERQVHVHDINTGKALCPPLAHPNPIHHAVFSPDGKRILTYCCSEEERPKQDDPFSVRWAPLEGGEARIWEVATGKCALPVLPHRIQSLEIANVPRQHKRPFFPAWVDNGTRILTRSEPAILQLWDASTGKPAGKPLSAQPTPARVSSRDWYSVVALDRAGERVLTIRHGDLSPFQGGVADTEPPPEMLVWDVRSGEKTALSLPERVTTLEDALIAPDGRRVFASLNRSVLVWEVGPNPPVTLRHPEIVASELKLSSDGRLLRVLASIRRRGEGGVGSRTTRLLVWDVQRRELAAPPVQLDDSSGIPVEFSPDHSRLLQIDEVATVIDTMQGKVLAGPFKHDVRVMRASFSPDGAQVLTVGADSAVRIWSASTGAPATGLLKHDTEVTSTQFSPDGSHILTIAGDFLRLWPVSPVSVAARQVVTEGPLASSRLSADGLRLLTVTELEAKPGWYGLRVHDAATARPVTPVLELEGNLTGLSFSPNGRHVLVVTSVSPDRPDNAQARNRESFHLWDTTKPAPVVLGTAFSPATYGPSTLRARFSEDGQRVIADRISPRRFSGETQDETRVWELATGKEVGPALISRKASGARGRSFMGSSEIPPVFSEDASRACLFESEGLIYRPRVVDVTTGKEFPVRLDASEWPPFVRFSRDGTRLLCIWRPPSARIVVHAGLWDVDEGKLLSDPLNRGMEPPPGRGGIRAVAHLQPGKERVLLLVGLAGGQGEAWVWDLANGRHLTSLRHEGTVLDAAFSPDGKTVATACSDGTARMWDAETGVPVTLPLRHAEPVVKLVYSSDGRRLLTWSSREATSGSRRNVSPGLLRLWDAATGQPLSPAFTMWRQFTRATLAESQQEASRNLDRLALARAGGVEIIEWNAETGSLKEQLHVIPVLACRRATPSGSLQPLSAQEFRMGWEEGPLQARGLQGNDWHRERLESILGARLPEDGTAVPSGPAQAFATLWHLDRLAVNPTGQVGLYATRGTACKILGQLDRAAEEFGKAAKASKEPGVWIWQRGEVQAERGKWAEALADFQAADAEPDLGEPREFRYWPALALLQAQAGDLPGCRKTCAQLRKVLDAARPGRGWGNYSDRYGVCLLVPGVVDDPLQVHRTGSSDYPSASWVSIYVPLGAAALYRAKQYGKAADLLLKITSTPDTAQPTDWFFLALAQQGLKETEKARESLAHGIKLLEEQRRKQDRLIKPELEQPVMVRGWEQGLADDLLRKEAEKAIGVK